MVGMEEGVAECGEFERKLVLMAMMTRLAVVVLSWMWLFAGLSLDSGSISHGHRAHKTKYDFVPFIEERGEV